MARVAAAGLVLGALLACGTASGETRASERASVALIVAVDVSQSVDDARFRLQMEGIADALQDGAVLAAITGNPGGILFAMVTWADGAHLAVGWQRIAGRADADAVAARVRVTPRQPGEFTCLGQMLRTVRASVVPALPVPAERVVVDVSGDGIDNCTEPDALAAEREELLADGATINGLPILVPGENDVVGAGAYRAPGYGLRPTPLPPERTDLAHWYRAHVIGGPGAFLLTAAGYADFTRALRRKFVLEISSLPERPANAPRLRSETAFADGSTSRSSPRDACSTAEMRLAPDECSRQAWPQRTARLPGHSSAWRRR